MRTWILSDSHKIGTINQCIALAEALNLNPVLKKIDPKAPWRYLPPQFWLAPLRSQKPGADNINEEPGPELIIASGRAAVAPSIALKKKWSAKVIFIQNPRVDLSQFDLVIPPLHDGIKGDNVIVTDGALTFLPPQRLIEAAHAWQGPAATASHPRWVFLLGGDTSYYTYTTQDIENIGNKLKQIIHQGGSLLVSPSRRTRLDIVEALAKCLKGENVEIWDGIPPNPYHAYLGLADRIIVTSDSVSMLSEACSTGKLVYVAELPSGNPKHKLFYNTLYVKKHARPLSADTAEDWSVVKLDEVARVADLIRRRFDMK